MTFQYSPPPHNKNDIIYIDNDLLIINKPEGLLSVPGRGEDKQDCLINRIKLDYSDALIVHRLDMDTSGLMIFARNKVCHRMLSDLFQQRKVKKRYIAIVDGILDSDEGEISAPLITDWPNRPKQKIDYNDGKPSITYYKTLARNTEQNASRIELNPITGRSHQLRVHMKSIGHAILGDNLYADSEALNKSPRLLLHSSYLELIHPVTNQLIHHQINVPF